MKKEYRAYTSVLALHSLEQMFRLFRSEEHPWRMDRMNSEDISV